MNTQTTEYSRTFRLGNSTEINRMGYGAMQLTGKGVWGPPQDKAECLKVLKRAVELGVNFIDTADSYGPDVSENLIAEALHPYPEGLVIATKGGFMRTGPGEWQVNGDPKHLQKALEGSMKRLKVDQIDLYQLHRIDSKVPFEKMMEFLKNVQDKGLVRHIGLSEVSIEQVEKAQKYVNIVSVQNKYSLDNRDWEDVLEYCEKQQIAFIPWYPLNSGKVDSPALKKIAEKHESSPMQVALSWLLHHKKNILLIPGTSKVKHLEENMKASGLRLSQDDLQELDHLR